MYFKSKFFANKQAFSCSLSNVSFFCLSVFANLSYLEAITPVTITVATAALPATPVTVTISPIIVPTPNVTAPAATEAAIPTPPMAAPPALVANSPPARLPPTTCV